MNNNEVAGEEVVGDRDNNGVVDPYDASDEDDGCNPNDNIFGDEEELQKKPPAVKSPPVKKAPAKKPLRTSSADARANSHQKGF